MNELGDRAMLRKSAGWNHKRKLTLDRDFSYERYLGLVRDPGEEKYHQEANYHRL
jgi:hypothetical protein